MKRAGFDMPPVRWGIIESALQLVSPHRALRRYKAKVAAAHLRRSYEAAAKGRGTDGWRTSSTAADSEIAAAGSLLRDRMRDLVRNNALAAQAVQVLVNNMVGYGIRPRAASGSKARDKKVMALWNEWDRHCDAHGHTTFAGLQVLAVRGMIEGGDMFALRRTTRAGGRVPLQIELREADHLDSARFDHPQGSGRITQGIEYDAHGRRIGYWMFPTHPGDTQPGQWRSLESVRLPADMVAHLFERQRVQSRGVPWGTPAMRALQDLGDWQDAELTRKKIEASAVGVIFGDLDDTNRSIGLSVKDAHGEAVDQFEPGMFLFAEGGKDVKFNDPKATPGIREWNLVQMHIIAAGFRVPYALMSGDMSQSNFSSTRAGLNEFRRMIEQVHWQIIIPMFCQRIWEWFCEAAWTAGLIDTPDVPVEWGTPKFESVNPKQDAETDLLEVRAGFASLPQMVAKRGYDTDGILEETAEVMKKVDALGLVLDSDPRKSTRAGQPVTAPAPADGDEAGDEAADSEKT